MLRFMVDADLPASTIAEGCIFTHGPVVLNFSGLDNLELASFPTLKEAIAAAERLVRDQRQNQFVTVELRWVDNPTHEDFDFIPFTQPTGS